MHQQHPLLHLGHRQREVARDPAGGGAGLEARHDHRGQRGPGGGDLEADPQRAVAGHAGRVRRGDHLLAARGAAAGPAPGRRSPGPAPPCRRGCGGWRRAPAPRRRPGRGPSTTPRPRIRRRLRRGGGARGVRGVDDLQGDQAAGRVVAGQCGRDGVRQRAARSGSPSVTAIRSTRVFCTVAARHLAAQLADQCRRVRDVGARASDRVLLLVAISPSVGSSRLDQAVEVADAAAVVRGHHADAGGGGVRRREGLQVAVGGPDGGAKSTTTTRRCRHRTASSWRKVTGGPRSRGGDGVSRVAPRRSWS